MSTVIGIFEDHYKRKKALPVVKPEHKQEDLHIDDTVRYVIWLGKKIFVVITVYLVKKVIQF